MKKNSLIKGILLVTIMSILMGISMNVYAADAIVLQPDNSSSGSSSSQNTATNGADSSSSNTSTATNNTAGSNSLSSSLTPTTSANTSTNTSATQLQSNLPKTGIADNTAVFAVLGICAVAAIYAYKKVRDYKGI